LQHQLGTTTVYVTHDQTEAMTLGDRIAVMRSGVLQQVGSPADLYSRPQNLFVAGFIGSPSMNFLPGTLGEGGVQLPIGTIPLSDHLRSRLGPSVGTGQQVIAGLRPEHFEDAALVSDRSAGVTFRARIDVVESMGSELYAYFELEAERVSASELQELAEEAGAADLPRAGAGSQVVARLSAASNARAGQESELWFNARELQLFAADGGRNLLAG
jgi:multiple sugar transport system ATP-binding protein